MGFRPSGFGGAKGVGALSFPTTTLLQERVVGVEREGKVGREAEGEVGGGISGEDSKEFVNVRDERVRGRVSSSSVAG